MEVYSEILAMPKGPIPRHEPGDIDESNVVALMRDWHRWQITGSSLYHCALRAAAGPENPDRITLFFGKPEAAALGREWIEPMFEPVAGMLFGMAVEAWLKGLCVLNNPLIETKELFSHDLKKLAIKAGIDSDLDDDDRDFLELCHSLVVGFGRFASPKEPEQIIPWVAYSETPGDRSIRKIASDPDRWDAINGAIWKRFETLELAGKTGRTFPGSA